MQSAMGEVEETVGKMTGLESWKTTGQERRAQGDTEYNEAQAKGYAESLKDRALGKKDQVSGAVSGDTTQEASGAHSYLNRLMYRMLIDCRPRP